MNRKSATKIMLRDGKDIESTDSSDRLYCEALLYDYIRQPCIVERTILNNEESYPLILKPGTALRL